MSPAVKGIIATGICAGVFWLAWEKYYDFLNQGKDPTESTKLLNKLEKEGVPNLEIVDIEDRKIMLHDLKGKVAIVNFWASWCDPCVEEFPSLIKMIEHFKGEVVLLAISADYTMEDMEIFLKAFGFKDPNIYVSWDKDQKIAKEFGTFVLPESYIVGVDGKLVKKIVGVDDWATPAAFRFFETLLKEKP